MDTTIVILIGIIVMMCVSFVLFEYRIRKPDVILLYESKGQIKLRKGLLYPRHFSLPLSRTTCPIQLNIEAAAVGNLEVRVKLVGSVAPSLGHIQSLIRVGGWDREATARAADEVQVMLTGLVKEYVEQCEIHALSSTNIVSNLNERATLIEEKFGVELISLAVDSLEPTDPEISEALRQQEQARLFEQTERLNHKARSTAAKAKFQADEEISQMEHALELKKTELKKTLLDKESALTQQSLKDELTRNRMRLAFEKEELELLKDSPELLMLTPQAARLAEASQNLKNARTIVSFTPRELAQGAELLGTFQRLLQQALEAKRDSAKADSKK
jgi:hypothetical protein